MENNNNADEIKKNNILKKAIEYYCQLENDETKEKEEKNQQHEKSSQDKELFKNKLNEEIMSVMNQLNSQDLSIIDSLLNSECQQDIKDKLTKVKNGILEAEKIHKKINDMNIAKNKNKISVSFKS